MSVRSKVMNKYDDLIKQAEELLLQAKELMESPCIIQNIPATCLEWQESDGKKYTWKEAMELGKDGWRLPTRLELLALYESGLMPSELCCWSASPCALNTSLAWFVCFSYGHDGTSYKNNLYYVRLVREVTE